MIWKESDEMDTMKERDGVPVARLSWRALVQALFDPLMNKEELARRISEEHPLLEQ